MPKSSVSAMVSPTLVGIQVVSAGEGGGTHFILTCYVYIQNVASTRMCPLVRPLIINRTRSEYLPPRTWDCNYHVRSYETQAKTHTDEMNSSFSCRRGVLGSKVRRSKLRHGMANAHNGRYHKLKVTGRETIGSDKIKDHHTSGGWACSYCRKGLSSGEESSALFIYPCHNDGEIVSGATMPNGNEVNRNVSSTNPSP